MYYGPLELKQQQFIACYYHPQYAAVGNCAGCGRQACMTCLQMFDGSLLCGYCIQAIEHAEAKSQIMWSWIVTGSVASLCALFILSSTHMSIGNGIPSLLLISYAAWSLYWGWGPIIGGIRNFLGELGCAGCALTIPVWIALGTFIVMVAMLFGMCGGGLYRYYKAWRLVSSSRPQ